MKNCLQCEKPLTGRQRVNCSVACKTASNNWRFQNYAAQQARGWERKLKLVELKGGKCAKCGYEKNVAALCFHHEDKGKEFGLTLRKCSNASWERLIAEVNKCADLCSKHT